MVIRSLRNCSRTQQLLFPRQPGNLLFLTGRAVTTSEPVSSFTEHTLNPGNRLGKRELGKADASLQVQVLPRQLVASGKVKTFSTWMPFHVWTKSSKQS